MKRNDTRFSQKPRCHCRERFAGFTLIEMLVVIAIIALLAALIMPGIGATMKRASQAKALSNFRQLGSIFMLYSIENNEHLPGPFLTNQRSGYRQGLPMGIGAKLWNEMGIPQPKADFQPVPLLIVPALWNWKYTAGDPNPGAYTVIRDVAMPDGTTRHPFGLSNNAALRTMKIFLIPEPASTWALWERGGQGDPSAGNRTLTEPIHGERRVVLFFDGHVEAVPSHQLPAYLNP